jgi:hypothetical protein
MLPVSATSFLGPQTKVSVRIQLTQVTAREAHAGTHGKDCYVCESAASLVGRLACACKYAAVANACTPAPRPA